MGSPARILLDAKNPSQYSVDEVIKFFWPDGEDPSWAYGLHPPDPALLGPAFRANDITGNVLLSCVTNEVLQDALGVSSFAQRAYMLIGINILRVRSATFPPTAAPEQSSRTEPTSITMASTPLGSMQFTVFGLRAQSEPLHAIIPNTPAAGTTLLATTKKQPRRVTNIITTPLLPKLTAPAAPAVNSSSASRSSLPPTDDDGKPLHPGWERFKANIVKNNPENTTGNEDDVLPPYGESEYDTEDQMEIEALPEKPKKKDIPTESTPPVDLTEFNSIVDKLISDKRLEWIRVMSKDMWETMGRCELSDTAISDRALNDIVRFEKRLSDLRDAIYGHRYTSGLLIIKACESLDETLSDLFFREWQLAVLGKLEPSPEDIQQDGSEPHGMNTFATSGPPRPSDPSSTSNCYDSEDPGEPSGAESPSDACNSEDSDIRPSDEPAAKKPRLESDILDQSLPETSLMSGLPTGATREVIDLTGDSPEPEHKPVDMDTPILPRQTKRAIWIQQKRLEKKAAKTHAAQIKSCDSPEPEQKSFDMDVPIPSQETKCAEWKRLQAEKKSERKAAKIHAAQIKSCDGPEPKPETKIEDKTAIDHERKLCRAVRPKIARWRQYTAKRRWEVKAGKTLAAQMKSCDDDEERGKRERGVTPEDIELERLRIASSVIYSVPMPPSFPMSPRPLASEPSESPSVHPRSISPMSEEGMAMYQ
ncbi:SNF2-related protein [Penicillium canescens]|nr:SNF2-related protein [Penicillium canescens]KAJ6053225.1 SNF2-related protein [Penicillium canescens]